MEAGTACGATIEFRVESLGWVVGNGKANSTQTMGM